MQVNGKLRDTLEVDAGLDESAAEAIARSSANVARWLGTQEVVRVVFVPDRLLNFVVK